MACAERDGGESRAAQFALKVTPDRMAVLFTGTMPDAGSLETILDAVLADLQRLGVPDPPQRSALADRFRDVPIGALIQDFTILRGSPVLPPRNGEIEWQDEFFREGFVVDEKTGTVDFRQRAAQLSVAQDQPLARVLLPRDGKDGTDVLGQRVAAGHARPAKIRGGPNVRFDEADQCFYATANGRIRWAGGVLAVDPVLDVHGSVGLATGNISHPGALLVGKDIEAGSFVKCSGDVEVKGLVEAADVESGGSLVVWGGVTGAGGRRVTAAGEVRAKFLRDASVEAGADVLVEKEIIQSSVKTRGAVKGPRARIIGGEIVALHGIDVWQAGSEAGIPTMLVAGEDYTHSADTLEAEREAGELEMQLADIRHGLEASPPPSQADRQALEVRALAVEEQLTRVRRRTLDFGDGDRRKVRIILRGTVFPEVTLRIGRERMRFSDALQGPVQAVLAGGSIVLLPVGPAEEG